MEPRNNRKEILEHPGRFYQDHGYDDDKDTNRLVRDGDCIVDNGTGEILHDLDNGWWDDSNIKRVPPDMNKTTEILVKTDLDNGFVGSMIRVHRTADPEMDNPQHMADEAKAHLEEVCKELETLKQLYQMTGKSAKFKMLRRELEMIDAAAVTVDGLRLPE